MDEPLEACLVGDEKVGKTVLWQRITGQEVSNIYKPTIGESYVSVNLNSRGRVVELHLFDTAGQEMFRPLIPMYLSNKQMVLIVYDVTSTNPFEQYAEYWCNFITSKKRGNEQPDLIFVCNKVDQEKWTTPKEEIIRSASRRNIPVFFVSSIMNEHIDEVVNYIQENIKEAVQNRTSRREMRRL